MGTENLGEAIGHLKLLLRGGADAPEAVLYICDRYDVVERALRRWFEEDTGKTPEEYRDVERTLVTIESAISAAASRWVRDAFGPNLVGRQFFLDIDSSSRADGQLGRGFRYIGFDGQAVEAIDEKTLRPIKFDGGPEIWREIRKQVEAAEPYEFANEIKFWGQDKELRARHVVLSAIKFVLVRESREEGGAAAIDERLRRAPTLTLLYQSLTSGQRKQVLHDLHNPPVQAVMQEGGKRRSLLLEPVLEVIERLQEGNDVPSPIHERD